MTDHEMAREIALRVRAEGGTAYYVGGYVRDRLLGRDNKDIDIEVHGITPDALAGILSSLGEMTTYGESFGIFGLRHCHLDIAMPRSERAVGPGHRDFLCTIRPSVPVTGISSVRWTRSSEPVRQRSVVISRSMP